MVIQPEFRLSTTRYPPPCLIFSSPHLANPVSKARAVLGNFLRYALLKRLVAPFHHSMGQPFTGGNAVRRAVQHAHSGFRNRPIAAHPIRRALLKRDRDEGERHADCMDRLEAGLRYRNTLGLQDTDQLRPYPSNIVLDDFDLRGGACTF